MLIIDMHTHAFSPATEHMVEGRYDPSQNPYRRFMSPESRETDAGNKPIVGPKLKDPAVRLADMARMGVDMQVVAPAPPQQHYWADAELLDALSRRQNDDVAALCATHPDHFVGLATLPLPFPDLAIAEATRAVEELGLRGFQIDSHAGPRELSDPAFDPLWARIAALGLPLFIHPLGFSDAARLSPFFMVNTVGQPLEEVIAGNHFIFGGVLDRHPELKVVIAHGGGYLPFYVGRLDHAWRARAEVRKLTADPPSTYLRRMWFDTCVFRPQEIDFLVAQAGPERVMLGSDYPFDMGDPDPVGTLEGCTGFDAVSRQLILGGTAQKLFRIT